MNKLVEIRNLCGYEQAQCTKNINLTVYDDDLGIIGPNGGGKTTLVKAILGLIKPTEGTITFFENGEKVNSLNVGYLPQVNQIDKKFPITVFDVILSGLTLKGRIFKRYSSEDREKVRDIAKQMGVENLLSRQISELSGGQLQRVLLARAIIDEPRLIILDEPGSYVDKRFETNFYRLLADLNEKMVIILVSHDIVQLFQM